jgi:hypothetical protein
LELTFCVELITASGRLTDLAEVAGWTSLAFAICEKKKVQMRAVRKIRSPDKFSLPSVAEMSVKIKTARIIGKANSK